MTEPARPLLPPVLEGEVVPGLEVVMVDKQGVRKPRPLRMSTAFRYTNENGAHALARDIRTDEAVVIRHNQINPPSEYTGGQSSPFRLYRQADVDPESLSGFADDELVDVARVYGTVDFDNPDAEFERRIEPFGPVRPGQRVPANSLLLIFGVGSQGSPDRDVIDVSLAVRRTGPAEEIFQGVHWYDDMGIDELPQWWAVVAGSAVNLRYDPHFDVDRCGLPVTDNAIAQRVAAVARNLVEITEHLQARPIALSRMRGAVDAAHGLAPGLYLGEDHQAAVRLDQCARSLDLLAPHCGRRVDEVREVSRAIAWAASSVVRNPEVLGIILGERSPDVSSDFLRGARMAARFLDQVAGELSPQMRGADGISARDTNGAGHSAIPSF